MGGPVNIVEFIAARIAEDEQAARDSFGEEWGCDRLSGGPVLLAPERLIVAEDGGLAEPHDIATGQHIARHDPVRVLRQSEVFRKMVDEYQAILSHPDLQTDVLVHTTAHLMLRSVIRPLAEIWSDHADYQREWATPRNPAPQALPPAPERPDLLRLWDGQFNMMTVVPLAARCDGPDDDVVLVFDRHDPGAAPFVLADASRATRWLTVDNQRGRRLFRMSSVNYTPAGQMFVVFHPESDRNPMGIPMDRWTR